VDDVCVRRVRAEGGGFALDIFEKCRQKKLLFFSCALLFPTGKALLATNKQGTPLLLIVLLLLATSIATAVHWFPYLFTLQLFHSCPIRLCANSVCLAQHPHVVPSHR
jgi:hypothetical protein